MIVGIATATDTAKTNKFGIQVECIISDYLSKDKLVKIPITLFHPPGSRFANQTTMIKHGSFIFFSGSLTQVENDLYLELHNFCFIRNQSITTSSKQMPWSLNTPNQKSFNLASANIAQSIHNNKKSSTLNSSSANIMQSTHKELSALDNPISGYSPITQRSDIPNITKIPDNLPDPQRSDDPTIEISDNPTLAIPKATKRARKNPPTPTPTPKRKTRSSNKTNKVQKLADIASNIIAVADSDPEEFEDE